MLQDSEPPWQPSSVLCIGGSWRVPPPFWLRLFDIWLSDPLFVLLDLLYCQAVLICGWEEGSNLAERDC